MDRSRLSYNSHPSFCGCVCRRNHHMLALVAHVGGGYCERRKLFRFSIGCSSLQTGYRTPTTQLAQLSRGSESILLASCFSFLPMSYISSCVCEEFETRMRRREVGCVREVWVVLWSIRCAFQRAWRRGERCESGGKSRAAPRTSTQREAGLRRGNPKQPLGATL